MAMSQNGHLDDPSEYFSGGYLESAHKLEISRELRPCTSQEMPSRSGLCSLVLERSAPFWRLWGFLGRQLMKLTSGQQPRVLKSREGGWPPAPLAAFFCGSLLRGPAYLASFRLCHMLCMHWLLSLHLALESEAAIVPSSTGLASSLLWLHAAYQCLPYGYCFCFNLVLFKKEILCSLGWPKTPFVAKKELEFPIMSKY